MKCASVCPAFIDIDQNGYILIFDHCKSCLFAEDVYILSSMKIYDTKLLSSSFRP